MISNNAETILSVQELNASIDDTQILNGFDITVKAGEIHAIMGPNGSGKSTFSKVVAGHPSYTVGGGTLEFQGKNLMDLEPDERAKLGIFLGFQYPVEVPGVTNGAFLRLAYNTVQIARGGEELDPLEFDDYIQSKLKLLDMDAEFLERSLNEGFSGGEKKRNEILQMAILEPKLAILDETDSGLDIDALRVVANGVNTLHGDNDAVVLVTHYQRLLNYIEPDFIHVVDGGRIIKTGDKSLAHELESRGYEWILDENKSSVS
jgi:Fe-S cluster assembly ATP-binding protein